MVESEIAKSCLYTYCMENNLEYLLKEWHPTKNGSLTPFDVTAGSGKKVWWYLPYDDPITGKHFDFEWENSIGHRTDGEKCPYLVGKSILVGFNDLQTVKPELAKQWHPTKNGNLTPLDVTVGSKKRSGGICLMTILKLVNILILNGKQSYAIERTGKVVRILQENLYGKGSMIYAQHILNLQKNGILPRMEP